MFIRYRKIAGDTCVEGVTDDFLSCSPSENYVVAVQCCVCVIIVLFNAETGSTSESHGEFVCTTRSLYM